MVVKEFRDVGIYIGGGFLALVLIVLLLILLF